ncbi:hypothetical protein DEO48_25970 [Enterobacter sp. CGMCC 5087]|nr:hypothetical protein DEO48_25970 [Enterobacter sp. CGMCC 5087]
MAYFFMLPSADDILLLIVIFSTLMMSAYVGRFVYKTNVNDTAIEPSIITGATLTLSGLLIGFVFSVTLSGYSARGQAEVNEAQMVGSALQYSLLLPDVMQKKVQPLLKKYVNDRIHFFREDNDAAGRGWARETEEIQQKLWHIVLPDKGHDLTPVLSSVLKTYNELMTSKQKTSAVWKRQVPDAAWIVLLLFAMSACFLTGHQDLAHPGYLLVLPVLTSLVLFVIAEIDIPGQGIIRVTPDDLEQISAQLITNIPSAEFYNLTTPVHHVPR